MKKTSFSSAVAPAALLVLSSTVSAAETPAPSAESSTCTTENISAGLGIAYVF